MASSAQSTLLDPLSFLKLTPDGDDVELSTGGAETRNINCSEENILAAPSDTDENFATEEKGATVRVASCIWGEGTSGREKVQNVLRLVPSSPQPPVPLRRPLSHRDPTNAHETLSRGLATERRASSMETPPSFSRT